MLLLLLLLQLYTCHLDFLADLAAAIYRPNTPQQTTELLVYELPTDDVANLIARDTAITVQKLEHISGKPAGQLSHLKGIGLVSISQEDLEVKGWTRCMRRVVYEPRCGAAAAGRVVELGSVVSVEEGEL